ncbi:MAG: hypothetical protein ABW185_08490 [Sedimenticola sp.]
MNRQSGELEGDCREITEERLVELLQHSSRQEVEAFAKSLGSKPKGSKADIVMQIKVAISKDNEKFKKAFSKLWGRSGGWVSGTCTHGIIYCVKFVLRAEGPRDYIDLLLSMKHQPNIVVSDMANMLVAHGNKRQNGMFQPFNGMVAEPTVGNVQMAKNGQLDISLPWLTGTERRHDCTDSQYVHPISGSDWHLCLFDRFHERNVKKEEEVMRRITHVKQLKGRLNSQKDEQLHAKYNHDMRYLNEMQPINHIFLFRCNIDVHNERVNHRMLEELKSNYGFDLTRDKNGCVLIDKDHRLQKNIPRKRHYIPETKRHDDPSTKTTTLCTGDDSQTVRIPETVHARSLVCESGKADAQLIDKNQILQRNISHKRKFTPEITRSDEPSNKRTNLFTEEDTQTASTPQTEPKRPFVCDRNKADEPPTGKTDTAAVNDHGTASNPIDCANVPDQPVPFLEQFWLWDLCLKHKDKKLIEDGYWLNDQIINAAIILLKKMKPEMGGLQDVITQRYGHDSIGSQSHFVQIVCINDCHWITISNINALPMEVFIYDCMLRMSERPALKRITYPPDVGEIACKLLRPSGNLNFSVMDVHQQTGAYDCGLFAIAHAASVCIDLDPGSVTFNQPLMRTALLNSLQTRDMTGFVRTILVTKPSRALRALYQWQIKVFCTCRLPVDGADMVQCITCKKWFHKKCISGDIQATWICAVCTARRNAAEERRIADLKDIPKLREMSSKNQHTAEMEQLYDAINKLHKETLPDGRNHIGCITGEEYRQSFSDSKHMRGITYSVPQRKEFFITIFHEEHSTPDDILVSVVHEIAHAVRNLQGIPGTPHGRQFKRIMKSIFKCVKAKQRELPTPYCDVSIDLKKL